MWLRVSFLPNIFVSIFINIYFFFCAHFSFFVDNIFNYCFLHLAKLYYCHYPHLGNSVFLCWRQFHFNFENIFVCEKQYFSVHIHKYKILIILTHDFDKLVLRKNTCQYSSSVKIEIRANNTQIIHKFKVKFTFILWFFPILLSVLYVLNKLMFVFFLTSVSFKS